MREQNEVMYNRADKAYDGIYKLNDSVCDASCKVSITDINSVMPYYRLLCALTIRVSGYIGSEYIDKLHNIWDSILICQKLSKGKNKEDVINAKKMTNKIIMDLQKLQVQVQIQMMHKGIDIPINKYNPANAIKQQE